MFLFCVQFECGLSLMINKLHVLILIAMLTYWLKNIHSNASL